MAGWPELEHATCLTIDQHKEGRRPQFSVNIGSVRLALRVALAAFTCDVSPSLGYNVLLFGQQLGTSGGHSEGSFRFGVAVSAA